MQTYNSFYEQELVKTINAEIDRMTSNLFTGSRDLSDSFIKDIISRVNMLKVVRDELMPDVDRKCQEKL